MNFKSYSLKAILSILYILAFSWYSEAGIEPVLRNVMGGTSLRTDSFRVVEDPEYAASNLSAYNLYKVNNYVSLEINQDQIATCFLDSFHFTAEVEILGWDESGTQYSDTAHLVVYYNQLVGKEYTGIHTMKLEDYYKLQIRIISVSDIALTDYVRVSAEIAIERYQDLAVGTTPTISSSSYNATTGDISVSWAAIDGAEEYDLEYTYVDDYDGSGGYIAAGSLDVYFKNNATRVSLKETSYSFSNVFEHGYVVFRVRGAGYTGADFTHRIQGPWSDQSNTSSLSDYSSSQKLAVTALNTTLNWQYVNTFSEWGKRKELISFMDGSYRTRQSITRISSDTTLIVGESVYDYQGRAALQILPVPIDKQKIEYQADFNLEQNTQDNYNRIHFDTGTCGLIPLPMDTLTGASGYYSGTNEFLTQSDHWLADHNPYIPRAEGYPFTRTIYTPDNSERVAIQSGVGAAHAIGSGHETRYFYATPFQEELDRLFGNNVGVNVHYQKQMTIDPNGQVSVSYTDLSGKVIATALGGATPTNVSELANNDGPSELEVKIVSTEHTASDPYSLSVAKTINVTVQSEYRLSYILNLASFDDACWNECAECVYDLKLSVKDECGAELLDGDNDTAGIQNFIRQVKRVDSSYFSTYCPTSPIAYKFTDDSQLNDSIRIILDKGSYIITKTLTVSNEAAEFYADRYLEDSSCVQTLNDFQGYFAGLIDDFGCDITCESCTEMLSDSVAYKAQRKSAYVNLGYADDTELDLMVSEEFQNKKAICEGICDETLEACDYKRTILETDVAPGGQYQHLDNDITQHPEYCVYTFCKNNPEAFDFENEFNNEPGGDESILNGWMNPLFLSPTEVFFPKGVKDNFFISTPDYSTNLQARLANVATLTIGGTDHELDIYEMVIYTTYCKDSTNWTDINSCIQNFDYESDKCAPRSPYAYELFRAVYLQKRKDALDSIMNASECSGKVIPEGKEARFWTNDQIEDLTPPSEAAMTDSLMTNCFAICDSMSYAWLQILGSCVLDHPDVEDIRLDLVDVCQRGCDANNPIGASSVSPSNISGSLPNSFQEVLESYGIYSPGSCNPNVISSVTDYENLNGDTASLLDNNYDCMCETAEGNENCLLTLNDPTLVAVMKQLSFDKEDTVCSTCLTCEELYATYNGFYATYGDVRIDTDSSQTQWMSVFTNFMNDTLGFDLSFIQYEDFIRECIGDTGALTFQEVLSAYRSQYGWTLFESASNTGNNVFIDYANPKDIEQNIHQYQLAYSDQRKVNTWGTYQNNISQPYEAQALLLDMTYDTNSRLNHCKCAQIMGEYYYFIGQDKDTNDVANWDSVTSFCGIPDISVINTAKDLCRQAYAQGTNSRLDGIIDGGAWSLASKNLLRELGKKYNFKIDSDCWEPTCGDYPNAYNWDDLGNPIVSGKLDCPTIIRCIDSVMNEQDWTKLQGTGTYWNIIADRIDSIYSGDPYNRKLEWQDSAYRIKRIRAEISHCIIDNQCLREQYFDTCSSSLGCYGSNKNAWNLRNYLDQASRPQSGTGNNLLATPEWKHSEVPFVAWSSSELYTGVYSGNVKNLIKPDTFSSNNGQPIYLVVIDSFGYQVALNLYFRNYSGENIYSDLIRVHKLNPIYEDPCDTFTTNYNILVSMRVNGGISTFWMFGSTDTLDLLSKCSEKLLLCNTSIPIVQHKCALDLEDMYNRMAHNAYDNYLDSIRENFIHRYKTHCIEEAINGEDFRIRFNHQEYHYTLYHYDLAGNLTQTVPPEGVNYLNSGQLTLVENFREGSGAGYYPYHDLPTYYQYNTLNELKWQATPDGGVSDFWYDRLGRLIVSRNAKQKAYTNQAYSYTLYDALGRITEVGEVAQPLLIDSMSFATAFNASFFTSWLAGGNKSQVTRTYYDGENFTVDYNGFDQHYLRNRVASTTFSPGGGVSSFTHAVHYDYDVHGNVQAMVREMVGLDSINQRYKILNYDYELVSGNVLMVSYQGDSMDRFFHKYAYDSDNRITSAYTSRDKIHWDRDANYSYYLHGPMARTELGELRVQGMDYAYTIHGWLKGVNSERLRTSHDIGKDGNNGSSNQWVCRDVFGFGLGYYSGTDKDYKSIGDISQSTNFIIDKTSSGYKAAAENLYNGNISYMVTAIGKFMEQGDVPFGRAFQYDQLNRLKSSRAFNSVDTTNNNWSSGGSALSQYATDYSYDANGNILTLERKGKASTLDMDDLTYHYYANTNRLEYVDDAVSSSNYGIDIDDQSAGNYTYDEIGNLISDASEEIEEIEWTVYGKIAAINRTSSSTKPNLQFEYSPDGHRVAKHVIGKDGITNSTWYVRDASGNIMATYSKDMYMELDTSNVFADSLILMIKNTETTETYIDFMIDGLEMSQYLDVSKYEELRDYLSTNSMLETTLETVSPMNVLGSNPSWASNIMDNVSDTKLNDALLMQYGDELTYANSVFSASCYGVFVTDIFTAYYYNFAEFILTVSNPTDVQNLWDSHFFPMPYPGHAQAAIDLAGSVPLGTLAFELDNLNPGLIFNLYQSYAGVGALTTFFDTWTSLNTCARLSLGDGSCLDAIDQLDRSYLWDLVETYYSLSAIADEMIANNPEVFLRAGLLQYPDMALTLLETGTILVLPGVGSYPEYYFNINDVFEAIETYLPFGSVYLQNMKNTLMNGGHAAPGWIYSAAEHHLYGSSRLGVHQTNLVLASRDNQDPIVYTVEETEYTTLTRGKRNYELSNHLGNVQVVITDKRISKCDSELAIEYFEAEVLTAMDYYPFGMMMPDRQYYASNDSSNYRFGFNGMERDNEISGQGNNLDFGARIYDSRLGRFLSKDPISEDFPNFSPYQFANNMPISSIDEDGLSAASAIKNPGPGRPPYAVINTNRGPKQDYRISEQIKLRNNVRTSVSVEETVKLPRSTPPPQNGILPEILPGTPEDGGQVHTPSIQNGMKGTIDLLFHIVNLSQDVSFRIETTGTYNYKTKTFSNEKTFVNPLFDSNTESGKQLKSAQNNWEKGLNSELSKLTKPKFDDFKAMPNGLKEFQNALSTYNLDVGVTKINYININGQSPKDRLISIYNQNADNEKGKDVVTREVTWQAIIYDPSK